MEYYDQDQTQASQAEMPVSKKKKGFVTALVIALIALVILAGAYFAVQTFLRSSPQVRHISKNALFVARLNLVDILKKADIDELKSESPDENLLETLETLNMETLLKDPKSTGLFTMKPAYWYGEYDTDAQVYYNFIVLPIADAAKVNKFVKGIDAGKDTDISIKQKNGKNILEVDGDTDPDNSASLVWDKDTMILGVAVGTGAADENSAKSKRPNAEKKVLAYFDQSRAESIAAIANYRKSMGAGHDFTVWINTDLIATVADKGFKDAKASMKEIIAARKSYDEKMQQYYAEIENAWEYDPYYYSYMYGYPEMPYYEGPQPENLFEQILYSSDYGVNDESSEAMDAFLDQLKELKGSSFMTFVDFEKGKIKSGIRTDLSSEAIKKYSGMFKNLASTKELAKYLPADNLVGTATYSLNWDSYWKLMQAQYKKILDNAAKENEAIGKMRKHLAKACDGAFLCSMNIASGKNKYPFFTIAAALKKNSGAKDMLKELVKDGDYKKNSKAYVSEYGDDAFLVEDDAVLWTSDYSQYKRCDYGIKAKDLKESASTPLGLFLDVTKVLEYADDIDDDIEDIFENFTSVKISSSSSKGYPSKVNIEIKLKEEDINALKVLWDMIPDKDDLFQSFGRKEEVQVEDWDYDPYGYGEPYGVDTTAVVEEPYYY